MSTPGIAPQPFTLLRTKLHQPDVRSDWVRRPRLEVQLEQGLDRKLTLVSAPAGFGKSSLVAGALTETGRRAAWLSLDPGDNDPVRFWTYVIAAIQTVREDVGDEARQIITSPQLRRTDPAIISLLNEISELAGDLVLILDDYHVIEADHVHEDVSYLLDHQPANLHILLISRADPPISLARLRAHGQLAEIRATDLEFSTAEATILLNDVLELNLNPDQIEALGDRTEGWIVGLQLAALSLRGRPAYDTFFEHFTGSHQFILDYLTEEVLRALPSAQRQFLLRTSVLDRFCGELCQAVTGEAASLRMLDEIRRDNLFLIPLDPDGRWFRYHHLFADVLSAWLERDHPGENEALHLKAAAWFELEGYPGEAVDHALRSGDMARAGDLVRKHWLPLVHRGELATVLRWLDTLPKELVRDDPSLSLARCWVLFLGGQNSAIGPHMEQANDAYERLVGSGALRGAQQNRVAAQLAMMRSVLARGRGEHALSVAHAEEAARLVPTEMVEGIGTSWNMLAAARAGAGDFDGAIDAYEPGIRLSHAEGNLVGAYGCTYGQAMYMLIQGRLNEAEVLCRWAIDDAASEDQGDFPAAGSVYIAMARIEAERNRLDEAEAYLNTGLRIARPGGFGEAVRTGRNLRAYLAAERGELLAAAEILQDTERIVNAMDDPYLTGELNSEWAKVCLKAGELDAAREKLHILEEQITATQHANLHLWWGWLLPRLLCAEGRYHEASLALEGSIDRTRAANSHGELIHLLALQAVALDAMGNDEHARDALCEGLALGAPGGYIGRWLDAGPEIGPLLSDLRGECDTPLAFHPYLDSLLDACQAVFGEATQPQPEELLEPLTPREREIMGLICQGYSNPEIARELVVSINTIKKHTSNIYGKMGVRSRTQAIALAHELNLV